MLLTNYSSCRSEVFCYFSSYITSAATTTTTEWHSSRGIGWRWWLTGWDNLCLGGWATHVCQELTNWYPDLQQKIMDHLQAEQSQTCYLPKLRYEITNELGSGNNTYGQYHWNQCHSEDTTGECWGEKGSRLQTFHNAWQQRLERKIMRLR